MLFHLNNDNIKESYPLVYSSLDLETYYNRESGKTYTTINLKNIDDIVSLISSAMATNEYCTGIYISGNTITITEKPYTLGE